MRGPFFQCLGCKTASPTTVVERIFSRIRSKQALPGQHIRGLFLRYYQNSFSHAFLCRESSFLWPRRKNGFPHDSIWERLFLEIPSKHCLPGQYMRDFFCRILLKQALPGQYMRGKFFSAMVVKRLLPRLYMRGFFQIRSKHTLLRLYMKELFTTYGQNTLSADSIWEVFFTVTLTFGLSADSIWRDFLSNTWQMPSHTPLYERFYVGYRKNALSADSIWKEVFHAALLPTIPA